MEKRNGTTSIALLVEPIRSRGRAMLVVAIWIFIDQTQTHLHRPYKEKRQPWVLCLLTSLML